MSLEVCKDKEKKNLGKSKTNCLPKLWKCGLLLPKGAYLDVADYATSAALKTKIQSMLVAPINSRWYLLPYFSSVEDNSEAAVYEESVLSRLPVRDGQYRYMPMISKSLCTHKALFTHRAIGEGSFMPLDVDNQLFTTEPDEDGKLYGFTLALFWTEKLRISNGTESTKSPIIIDLADNEEIDAHGALIDGTVVNQLERLTDAVITLTAGDAFAAAGFMVDVKQECDGVPISGLLLADFLMYIADGITPQVIETAAEDANVPGRYNLIPDSAFVDGSVTLRAPSLLTVKAYEVQTPLTVNVP